MYLIDLDLMTYEVYKYWMLSQFYFEVNCQKSVLF